MQVVVQRLPKNTIKITITLDPQEIKLSEEKVWNDIVSQAEIDGFRKGKAPLELVKQKTDPNKAKAQIMADLIKSFYPKALEKENLKPVIEPKIEIEAFEPEKNFTFTATTALRPQITLGDYKKAVKEMYDKKLQEFRQQTQKTQSKNAETVQNAAENTNNDDHNNRNTHNHDHNHNHNHNHNHDHDHEHQHNQNHNEDDAFYLRTSEIIEAIASVASGEVSDLLIEEETNNMLSRLVNQLQALNLSVDSYLKAQNKTSDQLKQEYAQIAQRQLLAEFALMEAVKAENIVATDEEVTQTIKALGDEKLRKQYEESDFQKEYVRAIIAKNKLLWQLNEYARGEVKQNESKQSEGGGQQTKSEPQQEKEVNQSQSESQSQQN